MSLRRLYPACAIEFIHTYSLIHDDLPAQTTNDLRRGNPRATKKFGDAIRDPRGDALLTLAFETVAAIPQTVAAACPWLRKLLRRRHCDGMVGGQSRTWSQKAIRGADMLSTIHRSRPQRSFARRSPAARFVQAQVPRRRRAFAASAKTSAGRFRSRRHSGRRRILGGTGKNRRQGRGAAESYLSGDLRLARSHEIANDLATRAITELDSLRRPGPHAFAPSPNSSAAPRLTAARRPS